MITLQVPFHINGGLLISPSNDVSALAAAANAVITQSNQLVGFMGMHQIK